MKTRCPHCYAKFSSPDEHEGKKAKCPKCKQPFVIAPFQEAPTEQVCTKCGRTIGKLEQPCVFNGQIVCSECNQKLRKGLRDLAGEESVAAQSSKLSQKIKWLPLREANKGAIVVALLLICLFIGVVFQESSNLTKTRQIHVPFSLEVKTVPDIPARSGALMPFVGIGCSLCLLVRSFRPGLGFWRGILTFLGAFLLGDVIVLTCAVFTLILGMRGPPNPGGAFGLSLALCLFIMLGIISVKYGFLPDKGHKEKRVAVILAVLTGPFAWLYVYRKNWFKFWLNVSLYALNASLGVTLWIWSLVAWPWAIIEMARRPTSYFENYDLPETRSQ